MKVTIHQPDFMPWLGFFNKINKADKWVLLDHTLNNPRDAAFWCRRVKMLFHGQPKWLSLPLEKPPKEVIGIPINLMRFSFADPSVFPKALASVETSYRKAPFFDEVIPLVRGYFTQDEPLMSKRNFWFIKETMRLLEIDTEIVFSSELECSSASTNLLVEILQKVNGSVYLCGGGATGYQDDAMFERAGVGLEYNNFSHPVYTQFNSPEFVPGLSVVDAMMNLGIEPVKSLIRR